MYRNAAGGPPGFDRRIIAPGFGVWPAVVGRSTAEEILSVFGTDCRVSHHEPSGEIFELSYDYKNDEDYEPDRPAQVTRPATFEFEFGMLKSIEIGVYQDGLATREGIGIETPREDVLQVFGPPTTVLEKKEIVTLRFVHHGVDFDVNPNEDVVMGIVVYRARW